MSSFRRLQTRNLLPSIHCVLPDLCVWFRALVGRCVSLLLQLGLDPDAVNDEGNTPLILATICLAKTAAACAEILICEGSAQPVPRAPRDPMSKQEFLRPPPSTSPVAWLG